MRAGRLAAWSEPGEIIQDIQDFTLRPDWRSPTATLSVGLIQVHGHEVGDRMAASGEHVADRAVIARTMPVDLSHADRVDHIVNVDVATGSYATNHARRWVVKGGRLTPVR